MASVITPSILTLHISSSLRSVTSEKRFQKDLTIADLKVFLVLLFNTGKLTFYWKKTYVVFLQRNMF